MRPARPARHRCWEGFGHSRGSLEELRGADAQQNAQIVRDVLSVRPSRRREIVALNASCAIYVADRARSLSEGIAKAEAVLDSGRALTLLERLIELTNRF